MDFIVTDSRVSSSTSPEILARKKMPVPNGTLHAEDEGIDYSDIEAKYVEQLRN